MKLDPRIIEGKKPPAAFDAEEAKQCTSGQADWFVIAERPIDLNADLERNAEEVIEVIKQIKNSLKNERGKYGIRSENN